MNSFIVFDVETANEKRSSICSIGIVVVEGNQIKDSFYTLVNPEPVYFNPYNVAIHGITETDVKTAPSFNELWESIKHYFEGNLVIAHNASFDMSCLRKVLDVNKIKYPCLDYNCSILLSKQILRNQDSYSLNKLADYYNLTFKHHNALEDAEVTAKLIINLMSELGTDNITDLIKTIKVKHGCLTENSYFPPKKAK